MSAVFFACASCGGFVHVSDTHPPRWLHDDGLHACPDGDGFAAPAGFEVEESAA